MGLDPGGIWDSGRLRSYLVPDRCHCGLGQVPGPCREEWLVESSAESGWAFLIGDNERERQCRIQILQPELHPMAARTSRRSIPGLFLASVVSPKKVKLSRMDNCLDRKLAGEIVSHMANLDRVFHSLGDGTRRAVITQLTGGPASVGDLAQRHRMALPSFMKHVRVLEASKIVVSRKKGRVRMCELRFGALALAQTWIENERRMWSTRLNQLDAVVETLAEREKTDGNE